MNIFNYEDKLFNQNNHIPSSPNINIPFSYLFFFIILTMLSKQIYHTFSSNSLLFLPEYIDFYINWWSKFKTQEISKRLRNSWSYAQAEKICSQAASRQTEETHKEKEYLPRKCTIQIRSYIRRTVYQLFEDGEYRPLGIVFFYIIQFEPHSQHVRQTCGLVLLYRSISLIFYILGPTAPMSMCC